MRLKINLLFTACLMGLLSTTSRAQQLTSAEKINNTTVELLNNQQQRLVVDFYGENIFRLFQDNQSGIIRDPEAKPEAKILVSNPRQALSFLNVKDEGQAFVIETPRVQLSFDKTTGKFKVTNLATHAVVIEEAQPVLFEAEKTTLSLKELDDEYFYGGGVQNGRFSHKGQIIAIVNENSWTDGGVASPTPFYWSTKGYAFMGYTFKKGHYDFGATDKQVVKLSHETDYLDVFLMVDDGIVPLLNDFYQLTGNPVLLPKFGFYEGHLNAYNRDYWKEDEKGILFEDGKRYKESQKDNGGTKESLNGEKQNYQFSARAVIDRYKQHDMPLGWILPNDGYGAGYGQEETFDGNIRNLKEFGDYARKNGVELGLWTQSNLHPKKDVKPLLQRDIIKEVRDAGVRVLKTDVAWVGAGYSFVLNGISDVAQVMPYYGHEARPFIISLDGWAGTQRYAGVWSGDQTGGLWEYIRFHIPTYIGSGLSGQPNITSDMDGIFGGKNMMVNVRDFEWKTFTPMQLNMDGWGFNEKYPHALGEPATSINRNYLKLKSQILPYTYSIAHEAVNGLPIMRATFLEEANSYTLSKATQYQFLYGPYFLVAPIYQETKADKDGNDVRHGIYLPKGTWIDYFTGDVYEGGKVQNSFEAPIWKLPLFVKAGAIIPMANPSNNVNEVNQLLRIVECYPAGESQFTLYDDDGRTEAYHHGACTETLITSILNAKGQASITFHATQGNYEGFVPEKVTELIVNLTAQPKKLTAFIGKAKQKLTKVSSLKEFSKGTNVYYYDEHPNLNRFSTPGTDAAAVVIEKNPRLFVRLAATDVTANDVTLQIDGYQFVSAHEMTQKTGALAAPKGLVTEKNTESYKLTPSWETVENADYYEILFNGMTYTGIRDTSLPFDNLSFDTKYDFQVRAVNKDGVSEWSTITGQTKRDPLEFAIRGIKAESKVEAEEDFGLDRLFDFREGDDMWYAKAPAPGAKATPFDVIMDLQTVNELDKIWYMPRSNAGTGTILEGSYSFSTDKQHWSDPVPFTWKRNIEMKEVLLPQHPTARYVKLHIDKSVKDLGSGREIYVFKVPGSASYLQGDINNDGHIDGNDLTSYMNYTGLRLGDPDFKGYISKGDINGNNLIDAYDIAAAATQIDGGSKSDTLEVKGLLVLTPSKKVFEKGDIIELTLKGKGLQSVNGCSAALTYDVNDVEYIDFKPTLPQGMENFTYNRLHSNGRTAVYPTFVNVGNQPAVQGDYTFGVIRLKAKHRLTPKFTLTDEVLVDK